MGNGASSTIEGNDKVNGFADNFKRGRYALENRQTERDGLSTRRVTLAGTDRISLMSSENGSHAHGYLPKRRGTITTFDQLRPTPPKTTKKELLKHVDFTDIDNIALQAPLDLLTKSMWDVVEYLVLTPDGKQTSDILKIRAIFRWMTSYDVYSIDAEMIPPTDSPLEHMLKIQYCQESHAQMLYALCMLADLPCVLINGVTKSSSYEPGSEMDYDELNSQWNAVFVKGQWRFVDVFWASTCVSGNSEENTLFIDTKGKITQKGDKDEVVKYNEFYFFTDPDKLMFTHLPDDDRWQLLTIPITMPIFTTMPFLREYFHLYEMNIIDKVSNACKIKAEQETINISFGIHPNKSADFIFRFMLSQKRTVIETNKPVDILLERFVSLIHTSDKVTFKIRLPFYGKYYFDIYACDITKSTDFSLLASYLIDCVDPKENCLPFPDCPEIGFGNNPHANKLQIYAISPTKPFVKTGNGILEFVINIDKHLGVSHMLKSLLIDPSVLSRHILTRREDNRYIANIKLPREGEYAIKFYVEQTSDNVVNNLPSDLLNFIVKFKGDDRPSNLPFPNIPDGQLGAKLDAKSLGIKCLSLEGDYIKATDGTATFHFRADKGVSLVTELSCCKREGNSRASVETEVNDDKWAFHADMPIPGEYTMNVFAFQDKDQSKLHQIHSFFIHSDGNVTRKVRFKDDNIVENLITDTIITSETKIEISIPPTLNSEKIFTTIRKTDEKIYETENEMQTEVIDNNIFLTLNDYGEYILEVFIYEKYENITATVGRFYIHRKRQDDIYEDDFHELVRTLKPREDTMPIEEPIPDRLDSVFEPSQFEEICSEDSDSDNPEINEEDEEEIIVEKSNINDDKEDLKSLTLTEDTKSLALSEKIEVEELDPIEAEAREKYRKTQEKYIKKNMAKSLKTKDIDKLRVQLKKFRELDLDTEDKLYVYTKKVVRGLIAKEKMARACYARDPKLIEKYLKEANDANYDHQLDMQIKLSEKILKRVRDIERLTRPLLVMNQNILTEMKKYQTPQEIVHHVLKATCILLGDNPKTLKCWKDCQAILFKTGKDHVMRRVTLFDITTVTPDMINKITAILEPYSFVQIRDVSKGAAAFYNWVTGILNEIQKRGKGSQPERLKSSRPRPAMYTEKTERTVVKI